MWIATDANDWIVYPSDASPSERDVIVCHELAHMLLDHQSGEGAEVRLQIAAMVAPNIKPDVAERFFHRHGYQDAAEADAEQLATMLVTLLGPQRRRQSAAA